MKKLLVAAIAITAIACTTTISKAPVEKVLIGGSFWDSIAIIDKATKNIEWVMALPEGSECNSVCITRDGNILFSYKKGAKLIDRQGVTIWDFAEMVDTAEMQTAVQLADGNYMVASCDNPLRIVELDSLGKPIKEVKYAINIAAPHAQFRVVTKAKNGNYLIPIITTGQVLEINDAGELVKEFTPGGNPFSLYELENGNLMVSCGDGHYLAEVDRTSGETLRKIDTLNGVEMQFVATAAPTANGNIMFSNWLGHIAGRYPQPQLVEFDSKGDVVWSFDNKDSVEYISTFYTFAE